ncbi:MAG: hypothetical protein HN406_08585 [Lentisphaerae bacterium]|jgi:hypothetical protein|nr:hypothetical protein [Lentisphaerota bacterium]
MIAQERQRLDHASPDDGRSNLRRVEALIDHESFGSLMAGLTTAERSTVTEQIQLLKSCQPPPERTRSLTALSNVLTNYVSDPAAMEVLKAIHWELEGRDASGGRYRSSMGDARIATPEAGGGWPADDDVIPF